MLRLEAKSRLQATSRWNFNTVEELPPSVRKALNEYVILDQPPVGSRGQQLEKLIRMSDPLTESLRVYRGMSVKRAVVQRLIDRVGKTGSVQFRLTGPSSFTNDQLTAVRFATKIRGGGDTGLVLELTVPAGTRMPYLDISFGVGWESLLSQKSNIVLTSIRKRKQSRQVECWIATGSVEN